MVAKKLAHAGVNVPMVSIPGEVTITKFPVVKEQMPVTCVGIVNAPNTALAKTISNRGKIGIQRCFCLFVGKKYYYFVLHFLPHDLEEKISMNTKYQSR